MNLSNESRLLILCATNGASKDAPEEAASLISDGIKWDDFLEASVSQGLAPLTHAYLKKHQEKTSVPSYVRDELAELYHGNVARNMYLRSELERILHAFNEQGIDVILLKGAALAWTAYGDIGLRTMGDIDILVRPKNLSMAKNIMHELSYVA
ncbi:MAG: nucleotidyltransferase family protein, partial [Nitrospirota bacterium]